MIRKRRLTLMTLVASLVLLGSALWAQTETAEENFRRGVIRAAVKMSNDGQITRRDVVKIRVAMLSPAFREKAHELAIVQMSASGSDSLGGENVPIDEDGKIIETAINWEGLAAFLEKLLPLILQLIDAFSYLDSIHIHVGGDGMPLYARVRAGDREFILTA